MLRIVLVAVQVDMVVPAVNGGMIISLARVAAPTVQRRVSMVVLSRVVPGMFTTIEEWLAAKGSGP